MRNAFVFRNQLLIYYYNKSNIPQLHNLMTFNIQHFLVAENNKIITVSRPLLITV